MHRRSKARLLKSWALEAGFDAAGVALLSPSEHADHLLRWLERGDHAGMDYLARRVEARLDPSSLLPGARSVLCVLLRYHPLAADEETEGDLWPGVARYARGEDYHDVMGRALRQLAERIRQAFPGCGTRPYVDTGPLLERELAARAGLGVMGKNTNLLHPRYGSWFLLGEILLTLDLEPDAPMADLCGSCRECLDACPTGALPAPYRLDSNRCISYWTIEHRGVIPTAMREGLGEWVFGCDLCQEVCPWNAEPSVADHPELELPPRRAALDLVGLLLLGREEYTETFRKSPMKRAKLEGLKRNAAVAMGNRGPREKRRTDYVEALCRALDEATSPQVRRTVAWALEKMDDPGARKRLSEVRSEANEPGDDDLRGEMEAHGAGTCDPP